MNEAHDGTEPLIRVVGLLPPAPLAPRTASVARSHGDPVRPAGDRIDASPRPASPGIVRIAAAGPSIRLKTTPQAAARIAAGLHQIRTVDGATLAYPSQDLRAIESTAPLEHGQTHSLAEHVGNGLAANVRRLVAQPKIRAAGGYFDEASAQLATDRTIANRANQRAVATFLPDPGRLKIALARVDLGATVGSSTTRADLEAGRPALIADRTATVVLIKDSGFPEGYRVLTSYPDTRGPEVTPQGDRQP